MTNEHPHLQSASLFLESMTTTRTSVCRDVSRELPSGSGSGQKGRTGTGPAWTSGQVKGSPREGKDHVSTLLSTSLHLNLGFWGTRKPFKCSQEAYRMVFMFTAWYVSTMVRTG